MATVDEELLTTLIARLDLDAKVRLLTGADFWSTPAEPAIGLRRMVLSDGPSGVRGDSFDERSPSLSLPSSTALGATWDPELARRYGSTLGAEARRQHADVVLGPTINLHRTPFGCRHFEALSEDPLLTGELAAAYVEGLQAHGVAATPKHYVANDAESERFTVYNAVGERALHELYLAAFEPAVTRGGAWAVMSAYNAVNGATMSENPLLAEPLTGEWGFDGLVMSDWGAVRTTVASARAEQHLVMPGPVSTWGERLVAAVRGGEVDESVVDGKLRRLLRLAARVGALAGAPAPPPVPPPGTAPPWPASSRPRAVSWSATPASCRGTPRRSGRSRSSGTTPRWPAPRAAGAPRSGPPRSSRRSTGCARHSAGTACGTGWARRSPRGCSRSTRRRSPTR
nr:glycoside hydrolase family 3 N-terminal domain-containing protein [Pseudonocardia sp. HH130629-09]